MRFRHFLIVATLAVIGALATSAAVNACSVTWDEPGNAGWIEGIRFYRDGVPTEPTAPQTPIPPALCADAGVVPCVTCVYTATFYRGGDEGPQSAPLAVSVGFPAGGRIEMMAQ